MKRTGTGRGFGASAANMAMASGDDRKDVVRVRVIYHGRVQGVGFRYTTHDLARDFPIGGFVRNLPDRNVELEAQGEPAAVESFLAAIAHHMRGNIRDATRCDLAPVCDECGFEIRY